MATTVQSPIAEASAQRAAVVSALAAYFDGLHGCDVERFKDVWHSEGHLLGIGPEGALVRRDAAEFYAGIAARTKSLELAKHDKILSVILLDDVTAAAKVQIALPAAPNSPTPTTTDVLYTDFLVLLRDEKLGWKIISKVYSPAPLGETAVAKKTTPQDFAEVMEAANRYLAGGRAGKAAEMATVFHSSARLTFSLGGSMVILSSAEFGARVEQRWGLDIHKAWAHLKDDPRIAQADNLIGVDFAGPDVALVTLQVGYPPFLYTDFLSFLKVKPQDGQGEASWWIAAKSSTSVPFLAEEKRDV